MSNLGGFFMRLSKTQGFTTPRAVFEDDLPDKATILLVYLFMVSSCDGLAAPGYATMMRHTGIASRTTLSRSLRVLREHGWFHFVRKGNGRNTVFHLRVPSSLDGEAADSLKVRLFPMKSGG